MIIPSPLNPTGEEPRDDDKISAHRVAASEMIQWLERLIVNEDFKRYLTFVRKGADATRASASNIDQFDPAKRDAYAQRHFGLVDMCEWPEKQLAAARSTLKKLNERPL